MREASKSARWAAAATMGTLSKIARERLEAELGPDALLLERSDLERYERGWRYGVGKAAAVVRPRNTEELRRVARVAAEFELRLHAIGANTGLVGASNPDPTGEQLVVSFERLNASIEIDPVDRTVTCDAGVTLSALNLALREHDLELPIDLGADPQVGGMIATNTGGTRLLKHGDVRRHLLGLEVVLPSGDVISQLAPLRKDNTGLDWKQLFVGTSGRFGFISRATLAVSPRPKQVVSALVAARDGQALLDLLAHLERRLGSTLTAFEAISRAALEPTLAHGASLTNPFPGGTPGYTGLVELTSTLPESRLDLSQLLEDTLGAYVESESSAGLEDVLFGRAQDFWNIRHQVSESLREEGEVLALDLSVPRSRLAAFTERARELLADADPTARLCDFGHWGDGGTHLNLVFERGTPVERRLDIQRAVYDLVVQDFGGSFSAEHGLGPHNQDHFARLGQARVAALTGQLAAWFDPHGRLARRDG